VPRYKYNFGKCLKNNSLTPQVRNSVCHNACVIANGFMHCGTTIDQFLRWGLRSFVLSVVYSQSFSITHNCCLLRRDNLDWLSRATNWAKFTATASLGVIHKGHEKVGCLHTRCKCCNVMTDNTRLACNVNTLCWVRQSRELILPFLMSHTRCGVHFAHTQRSIRFVHASTRFFGRTPWT